MKNLAWSLAPWVAALWWGSLCAVGFWVVPLLFQSLPSAYMAGKTAAVLFQAQCVVSLVCAVFLLLVESSDARSGRTLARTFILLGMIAALLLEFAASPRIQARENLAFWHAAGTLFYALECLSAGVVFWSLLQRGSVR